MSRPEDYRGAPPGSWRPTTTDQRESAAEWVPDAGRPTAAPGWPAPGNGPGHGYPTADGGGSVGAVAGAFPAPADGGRSYPFAGAAARSLTEGPTGGSTAGPTGAAPGVAGGGSNPAPPGGSGGRRSPLDPAKLFGIVIAALGALNFVFGFLPQATASRIDQSLSVYAVGPGYVPILLLIAGLLALAAFLPGSERSRLAVAAVSVGGAVGALISLGTSSSIEVLAAGQVSKGLGAVLLTIFGIIQAVVAIGAYVVGSDLRVGPRSRSAAEPGSGGGHPPTQHGWMAADPAPAWPAPSPTPPASGQPAPAQAPEPTGSVGYYAGYAPVPGSAAGPGGPSSATTGWEPPADDDRPTGPQRVVDPAESNPRSPAQRELPRLAPAAPVGAAPVELTKPADPSPDARSRHAAADDQAGPAATPPPAREQGDEGVTEVYRIPPRTGPNGPAGP